MTVDEALAMVEEVKILAKQADEAEERMLDKLTQFQQSAMIISGDKNTSPEDRKKLVLGAMDLIKTAIQSSIDKQEHDKERAEGRELLTSFGNKTPGMA